MKTIRDLRRARGWTQFALALKVGVQPQAVSLWEQGRRLPQVQPLRRLGVAFGLCSDDIVLVEPRGDPAPAPHRPRADRQPGAAAPGRDRQSGAAAPGRDRQGRAAGRRRSSTRWRRSAGTARTATRSGA
jgi:transcriptional regulator with XRE-family HTH domain